MQSESDLSKLSYEDLYLISDALHTAIQQGCRMDKQRQLANLLMRVDKTLEAVS